MAKMNSYYNWCMFFMSVIGLWPYTTKKLRVFQNGIISLSTLLFITAQFLALFTVERNLFRLLRLTSFIILTLVACTKYHLTLYQINDVKGFLDQIRLDWKTNNEVLLRIMQVHASHGRRSVIIFAAFIYPSACMIMLYHVFPIILDKIIPLNESRSIKFPVDVELFIDEEQLPISKNVVVYFSMIMDVTIFVGTESLMIMVGSHIAGLFEITSYHFQKAVLEDSSALRRRPDRANNKTMSYIVSGVIVHRMAVQFVRDVNNHCKIEYFLTIILGVIALSIHLFCLSQTVLRLSDISETMLSFLLLSSTLGYMFWMNLVAENAHVNANNISLTTYNTNWYETSIATQKLLQLIILNSIRGVAFNFLSVYVPSIEGFAALLKASVSYFTVLLSVH